MGGTVEMAYFRNGYSQSGLNTIFEATHDLTTVFERSSARDLKHEALYTYEHGNDSKGLGNGGAAAGRLGLSERSLDLGDFKALDDVTHLDVIVAFNGKAAFEAFVDFSRIIFESLQAGEASFENLDTVANDTKLGVTSKEALLHETASHGSDFRNMKDLSNLGFSELPFLVRRSHQAKHGVFDIVDSVIDDAIQADFNTF